MTPPPRSVVEGRGFWGVVGPPGDPPPPPETPLPPSLPRRPPKRPPKRRPSPKKEWCGAVQGRAVGRKRERGGDGEFEGASKREWGGFKGASKPPWCGSWRVVLGRGSGENKRKEEKRRKRKKGNRKKKERKEVCKKNKKDEQKHWFKTCQH